MRGLINNIYSIQDLVSLTSPHITQGCNLSFKPKFSTQIFNPNFQLQPLAQTLNRNLEQ